MRLSRLAVFLCVPFLLLGSVGCSKRDAPTAAGRRTRTLLVGNQNEPATLDPHLIDAATDMNLSTALFEGLTVFDEKSGGPLPGVAERWEFSADGLTCTFFLRHTARWSNGDRVTARDFAYSFQRILSPKLGSVYAYMLWPIRHAREFNAGKITDFSAVGVEVVDDTTLRLRLALPTSYLPSLAAHSTWMPVHRATIEKFGRMDEPGTAWTRPGNLVGNGPFFLQEWRANARIVTARNPHYWDAAHNQLEAVSFFPIANAEDEERGYRAGQLHVTFALPTSKIPVYRQQTVTPLRFEPVLSLIYLNFNSGKPPFSDPKVRRALALVLSRAAISQNVFAGMRPPASTLVPPHCGSYAAPSGQAEDAAAARKLLAEAGFPNGRGFPKIGIQVLNDNLQPRAAEAMQAIWKRELAIEIGIEPFEQKTWLQNQQSLAHNLGLMGFTADFPDPITFLDIFRGGGGNNWTAWANPDYDALLDRAAATVDPTARFALLREAEALLLAAVPIAPLVFGGRYHLVHPDVKGWEPAPLALHRYQLLRLE